MKIPKIPRDSIFDYDATNDRFIARDGEVFYDPKNEAHKFWRWDLICQNMIMALQNMFCFSKEEENEVRQCVLEWIDFRSATMSGYGRKQLFIPLRRA